MKRKNLFFIDRSGLTISLPHLEVTQTLGNGFKLPVLGRFRLFEGSPTQANNRNQALASGIGSAALAGTTYHTNRQMEAEALGFDGLCRNSIDGVSDRDFAVEMLSSLAILMMHLSRFSEEICLWCSWEFKFVELDDAFATGSSIMPQKKNPDIAELVRGKTGRVYGDLMAMLTVMKALPLAYNKDMQEDKEPVFDAVDTVQKCLPVFTAMLHSMRLYPENMRKAAQRG